MSSYLFIVIAYSNSDKNYIQTITSVKFLERKNCCCLEEYLQTTAKTLIYKRPQFFNVPEFCFIISQYSYGLNFFTCSSETLCICLCNFKNIIHV